MRIRKLLSDITASGVRHIVEMLHGIVLIPVLTKFLGAESYGLWVSIIAVLAIVKGFGGLHMKGALIRYQAREERKGQTLIDTAAVTAVTSVGAAIVFYIFAKNIDVFPGINETERLVVPITILIFVHIISDLIRNYPRAQGEVKVYEGCRLSKYLLEMVALAAVFYLTRDIVAGLWTLIAISVVIDLVIMGMYPPASIRLPTRERIRRYLRYSIPMVPKDLGGRFLTNADKYIILYFLSPTAVSIYAVSYAAANVVQTFAQMLGPTLYPTVTSEWDDGNITGIRRLYTTIFEWYTFVGMPATVGISILAFPVLRLLSTPVIAREGQMVVALLALGFFIYGYNLPLTFIINAAEKNEELSKITVVAAVANVFLNIILLPLIGIFGAVIATIVAQSATTVYVYYHTRSMIGFEFPLITFGKAAFATGAMAVVLILIPFTLSWQLKLIAFPVLGVLTYLGMFILVGGFSREEIREAIQFVTEDRVIE